MSSFLEEPNGSDPLQPPLLASRREATFSPLGDLLSLRTDAGQSPRDDRAAAVPLGRGGIHLFGSTGRVTGLRMITESTNGSGSFNFEYHLTGWADSHRPGAGRTTRSPRNLTGRIATAHPTPPRDQRSASTPSCFDNDGFFEGGDPGDDDDLIFKHYARRLLLRAGA